MHKAEDAMGCLGLNTYLINPYVYAIAFQQSSQSSPQNVISPPYSFANRCLQLSVGCAAPRDVSPIP